MYTQVISINSTQLNSGTAFTTSVNHNVVRINNQNYYYNARSLKVKNTSGAKLYYLPLTVKEYEHYLADSTLTDLIPIDTNEEHVLELFGQIDTLLTQGTSGHSDTIDFLFLQRGV